MSMYNDEQDAKHEEMMAMMRAVDAKVQMLLNDMDDIRETLIQLKAHIEYMEEEKLETMQAVGASKWRKESL